MIKEESWVEAWFGDDTEGNEGIAGVKTPKGWMPLVYSDDEFREKAEELARKVMHKTGKKLTLKRFTLDKVLKTMELSKHF